MTQSTTPSGSATPLPAPEERRRLREAKSLTAKQIAAEVGVSPSTIRSWESGRTTPRGSRGTAYAALLATIEGELRTAGAEQAPHGNPAADDAAPGDTARTLDTETTEATEATDDTGTTAPPGQIAGLGAAVPLTPAAAFDALYSYAAPALVRQTYLLTGRLALSQESVERAFRLAWERWPEVAVDRDPAGWVRAVAYDYAMSPWHRVRPARGRPDPVPDGQEESDRALREALLDLPPSYRRALLLYDGLGLDLPETAAETEASTPAAANRVLHAREAVAERLPGLADPEVLDESLGALVGAVPSPLLLPPSQDVRNGCERRARFWTWTAIGLTALIVGVTGFTAVTAPTRYEQPPSPGEPVSGVPPRNGPQRLTEQDLKLRDRLRSEPVQGTRRLVPQTY